MKNLRQKDRLTLPLYVGTDLNALPRGTGGPPGGAQPRIGTKESAVQGVGTVDSACPFNAVPVYQRQA